MEGISWPVVLCVGWGLTSAAVVSTTVYLHRCAAHRALVLHQGVKWVFRLIIWLASGDSTLRWVAVHRKHHAHADRPGDPHSPYLEGFWQIQLFNVYYYIRAGNDLDWCRYAPDVADSMDKWDKLLFNHAIGGLLCCMALLCLALGWWNGTLAFIIHFATFVFLLAPLINGLCHHPHFTGYQHTLAPQAATTYNNVLVAALTGGEGLHHNHHWQPHSARFSRKWWEPDLGWWVILLLERLSLAERVKR